MKIKETVTMICKVQIEYESTATDHKDYLIECAKQRLESVDMIGAGVSDVTGLVHSFSEKTVKRSAKVVKKKRK